MALSAYGGELARGNVLSAIAHPTVVDPAGALGRAADIANSLYRMRGQQAQQAWGNALQQATDSNTGVVDIPRAQAIAAQTPAAAYGMAQGLQAAAELRNNQQQQIIRSIGIRGSLTASLINDSSDANLAKVRQQAIDYGFPQADVDNVYDIYKNMSADDRHKYAVNQNLAAMDSLNRWAHTMPETSVEQTPGGLQGYVRWPFMAGGGGPEGAIRPGGGIPSTASPGDILRYGMRFQADAQYARENGIAPGTWVNLSGEDVANAQKMGKYLPQVYFPGSGAPSAGAPGTGPVNTQSGAPASSTNPPRVRQLNVPGTSPAPAATPAATPAPRGPNQAPTTPAPSNGATEAPVPAPPFSSGPVALPPTGATAAPAATSTIPVPPGMVRDPATGNFKPSSGTGFPPPSVNAPRDVMMPGPRTSALTPPATGAVGGDVNAILTGMANRAAAGRGVAGTYPQIAAGAAFGPGTDEAGRWQTSTEALQASDRAAATAAVNLFPYEQALSLYGRGMTTAVGADIRNAAESWAGGLARSLGWGAPFDTTKEYDALHKYLSQITIGNPVAQGSDARLAATLSGNANTGIHELAGADMIKAGIALQRMTLAANRQWNGMSQEQRNSYGLFLDFAQDFNRRVDPRAFMVDLLNPAQAQTLYDEVKAMLRNSQERANYDYSRTLARQMNPVRAMPQ